MNNTSFEQQLSGFGISLHRAIIDQLIGEIELAVAEGRIRSQEEQCSVYDFIREILGKKTEWEVWKRFCIEFPEVNITRCESNFLVGKRRRQTPCTDLAGLVVIACYLGYGKSQNKARKTGEKEIQSRLAIKLNGEIEVVTPVGNIDILTPLELIEVKKASSWKTAIGQVIAYGYFYPSHRKRIHLFGSCHSGSKQHIKAICKKASIKVTWEL